MRSAPTWHWSASSPRQWSPAALSTCSRMCFVNLLVFIPALIWSMYLLYKGLPIVLKTGPERGMLMASALIAYLLVGAVTVLGLTVAMWASGIGPSIGV